MKTTRPVPRDRVTDAFVVCMHYALSGVFSVERQLNAFRQLLSHNKTEAAHDDEFHGHIINNYRPTQPLNDRRILASFN